MDTVKILVSQDQVHQGNLILVNGRLPLVTQNSPRLMPMKGSRKSQEETVWLEMTAAVILSAIFQKVHSEQDIVPVSGYRDFLRQRQIYESSLLQKGISFTMKYVAMPGCSEHQTGLAIDLGLRQESIDYICPDFPYEGICKEFRRKAPAYGFIERYKAHKEAVTGIAGEPWHFRYVGYPHSQIIEDMDLSLEEYIEFLKDFPYQEKHFRPSISGQDFEIFYVNLTGENEERLVPFLSKGKKKREITLDERKAYQISGNNEDGCIFTVWS